MVDVDDRLEDRDIGEAFFAAMRSRNFLVGAHVISPVSYRKKVGQPPKFRNQGSGPLVFCEMKASDC